jgi:NAD(P)-dependent dehydrogenase (short-subunit alcohol dehydrogenase family)
MNEPQKTAVVTGVSTGIGRAIARALVDAGWIVFGSVRKEKDAAEASAALGANFTPLLFDVTDNAAIRRAAEKVDAALAGRTLDRQLHDFIHGFQRRFGVIVGGQQRGQLAQRRQRPAAQNDAGDQAAHGELLIRDQIHAPDDDGDAGGLLEKVDREQRRAGHHA